MRFLSSILFAAAIGVSAPALAAPALTSSTPAEKADAAGVTKVTLNFSEAIDPAASGIEVLMTGMPGMANHEPMKMTGVKTALAADKVTLVAKLPRPLPAGTYEANWHVVSTDTHRVAGKLNFTVK